MFSGYQKILLVEDDPEISEIVAEWLARAGYQIYCAASATEAWALLKQREFDCILMDLGLGSERGERLIPWLRGGRGMNSKTPILVISGGAGLKELQSIQQHVAAVMLKPFTAETLLARLDELLKTDSAARKQASAA